MRIRGERNVVEPCGRRIVRLSVDPGVQAQHQIAHRTGKPRGLRQRWWRISPDRQPRHQTTATSARTRPGQPDRSEEHTSELQSLMRISYAVLLLKKKNT